jgi:hypothetical protein
VATTLPADPNATGPTRPMTSPEMSGGATAPTRPMTSPAVSGATAEPMAAAAPPPLPAAAPRSRLLPIVIAVAAALAVVVGGVAWLAKDRLAPAAGESAAAPAGLLVIHAVPWAEVVSVTDAAGVARPLPAGASTPLSLTVPAGAYTVAVRSPESGVLTTLSVDVRAGQTVRCLAEVKRVDAEAFLAGMGWQR